MQLFQPNKYLNEFFQRILFFFFTSFFIYFSFIDYSLASNHGTCGLSGVPPLGTCSYSVTCSGGSVGVPAQVDVLLDDVLPDGSGEAHPGAGFKKASVTGSHTLNPGVSGNLFCHCQHDYDDGSGGYSADAAPAFVNCPQVNPPPIVNLRCDGS